MADIWQNRFGKLPSSSGQFSEFHALDLGSFQFFADPHTFWTSILKMTVPVTLFFFGVACYGDNMPRPANVEITNQVNQDDKIKQYRNQISVAGFAIDNGRPEIAQRLLAATNPKLRGWEYGFLKSECLVPEDDGNRKFVNSGDASEVVFTPDGKRLVFGRNKKVVVWDFIQDESVELGGHTGSIVSVDISPDGDKIASGGGDGKVIIWELQSGKKLLEYSGHNRMNRRAGAHQTQVVRDLAFSPCGEKIVSTAFVNTPFAPEIVPELKIWSVVSGKTLKTLRGAHDRGRTNAILCLDFSPDGTHIATGGFDHKLRIWDAESGKEIRTIAGHRNNVLGLAFSPDGKQIASASTDQTLAIWQVSNGNELARMQGHKMPVYSVQFSSSGKRVISSCCDRTVKVWHVATGLELLSMQDSGSMIRSITVSENDRRVATSRAATSNHPGVTVWECEFRDD